MNILYYSLDADMKRLRTRLVLPAACVLFSLGLLSACGSGEPAPFKDGDYFEYRRGDKDQRTVYRVAGRDDGTFRVTWEFSHSEPEEFIVDWTGTIIETPTYPEGSLGYDLFHDRQLILWLPADKRKVGEQIFFCDFIGKNTVKGERRWEKWDVWVTRHENVFGWQENYFDRETGFLVGSHMEEGNDKVLADSSIEALR